MENYHQIIKNIGFFILFSLLLVIAVLGVKIPTQEPVVSVGSLQISTFNDGLALYQGYRGLYYTISPFNDFVTNEDGRSSFISKNQINTKQYANSLTYNPLEVIPQIIGAYLFQQAPAISFTTKNETMHYQASVQENKLTVLSTFTNQIPPDPQKMGITLAYHSDDIIFDRIKNVYSYWDNQDLTNFKKEYGITLTPSQNALMIPIRNKQIFIMNPAMSGVIEVVAGPNQQLFVNRNAKLIEVVQSVDPNQAIYKTTLHITVLNSPEEIFK